MATALCAVDIRHNGFLPLGFYRTVGLMIQKYLLAGVLAGIAGVLAAFGLAALSRAIAGRLAAKVRHERRSATIETIAIPSLQLLVAVSLGLAVDWVGLTDWKPNRIWYLLMVGGALVGCKVLLDCLLAPEVPGKSRATLFSLDVWFSFSLVALVSSAHVVKSSHLKMMREWELIAVAIVLTVLVTGSVVARTGRKPSLLRLKDGLAQLCAALAGVALVTIGGVSFWTSRSEVPSMRGPNVILIVVDTLRADHLGCYQYDRPVSPSIDSLAARSTLFQRAIASAPWTLPSHASMFTGRNPYEHGVQTYLKGSDAVHEAALAKDQTTIAEVFRELGYRTGAFVANSGYLGPVYGLKQGFETYEVRRIDARSLNEHVQGWLTESSKRPFFLFVNYMDTHRPYNTSLSQGSVEWPVEDDPRLLDELIGEVLPGDSPVPLDLAQRVINQYDAAIVGLDLALGEFLSWLKRGGLFEETVIVVTSDHGEYFGAHSLVEHSKDVYEGALRIPLIVKGARQSKGRVSDQLVSSTDLPRLVLAELPGEVVRGLGRIFPDVPGNHLVIAENRYSRSKDLFHAVWGKRFRRVRTAVYEWPFKLILSSDGEKELFHLEADPKELRNLAASKPGVVRRLQKSLRMLRKRRPGREAVSEGGVELSDEEVEELRALGYL